MSAFFAHQLPFGPKKTILAKVYLVQKGGGYKYRHGHFVLHKCAKYTDCCAIRCAKNCDLQLNRLQLAPKYSVFCTEMQCN